MFEGMMITFVVGWFGGHWWPGMERGAPNPKDPQPWLLTWGYGVISGAAAVVLAYLVPTEEPMVNLAMALAAGRVARDIAAPVLAR